jgi:hypothetical protein
MKSKVKINSLISIVLARNSEKLTKTWNYSSRLMDMIDRHSTLSYENFLQEMIAKKDYRSRTFVYLLETHRKEESIVRYISDKLLTNVEYIKDVPTVDFDSDKLHALVMDKTEWKQLEKVFELVNKYPGCSYTYREIMKQLRYEKRRMTILLCLQAKGLPIQLAKIIAKETLSNFVFN